MSVTYTNRKGDTYHLHQGTTKKGNPKYHFSKKEPGAPVETIPDGYEIYENPNAQVFLRKIKPKLITDAEHAIVKRGIKKHARVDAIVDVKKNVITVHTVDQDFGPLLKELGILGLRPGVQDTLARNRTYTPMMRFILEDKQERAFIAERFCFRGSIDDWIYIGGPDSLEKLVRQYAPHLEQESFYELY